MTVLRNLSWTRVPVLFAVVSILSGSLMSPAAMAQDEKAVENFPDVLQHDITLWSDGTRLSGVLLYAKDREVVDPFDQQEDIDAEKEHYFKIKDNSGWVHEILKKNGVPTEYHVLKGKKHYDVYTGQSLDDVMKLEIAWFDKYLKGDK